VFIALVWVIQLHNKDSPLNRRLALLHDVLWLIHIKKHENACQTRRHQASPEFKPIYQVAEYPAPEIGLRLLLSG